MIGEGTVKPSSNIGPTLPIIGPGEVATKEANVLQARGNEFQSSWGVNGVDAEFFHCRGDHIEVPNNSPWVVVRKGRGTQGHAVMSLGGRVEAGLRKVAGHRDEAIAAARAPHFCSVHD
ncbi:hypothetical protein AAC387_Pa01g2772 [Persea americana]